MADAVEIEAPIGRVVVEADRARIFRRVHVAEAGRHRFRIDGISPLVRADQISCTGTSIVLEEARVQVELPRQVEVPARIPDDALERAMERVARAEALVAAGRTTAVRALAESGASALEWLEVVESMCARQVEILREEARCRRAAERAAETPGDTAEPRRSLLISVVAAEPGVFELSYVVPCAAWRPEHHATVPADGARRRMVWEQRAAVWNATGEDWTGVSLVCAAPAAAALTFEGPLVDDLLAARLRPRGSDEQRLLRTPAAPTVIDDALPVDGGPGAISFAVAEPVTVPGDGVPVFVAVGCFEADVDVQWTLWPARSGDAVLCATGTYDGPDPLLPGPIHVVCGSTAVGRTRIDRVAAGQPLRLGLGVHPALHAARQVHHHLERAVLGGPQRHTIRVETQITHTGSEPCAVTVCEMIPTIADPSMEIGVRGTPAPECADGVCRWPLALQPGEAVQLTLEIAIDAEEHIVLPFPEGDGD